ncbi:MAG: OmpA family protein [Prolixibacteraceae bacterium]|nr:OmpA family protein [Prolixibacteraceae bacterium]
MRKLLIFLVIGLLWHCNAVGQTIEKKWGFGAGAGGYYNLDTKTIGLTPEAYLSRYLSRSFDLMLHANIGYFGNQNINEPLDLLNPVLNLRYKLYNGYIFPVESKFQPYVYAGPGFMLDNAKDGINFNLGLGVKYPLSKTFSLYLQGGYINGIQSTREINNVVIDVKDDFMKLVFGIEVSFIKQPDTDKDGVIDNLDECPGTPKGATVDSKGCPSDQDNDGVFDGIDECPDTPAGAKVDEKGCPLDTDGDGVIDLYDQCPDTPKRTKVDDKGCPFDADGDGVYDDEDQCTDTPKGVEVDKKGCPLDADGDGVSDALDQCPDTPKGTKVDEKGCPNDQDGDGVSDDLDQCPDTPKGTKVDAKGCPDRQVTIDLLNDQLDPIYYATDASNVTSDQLKKIDEIVVILKENPDYMVNVFGYCDPRGDADYNKALSQRRINSVVALLKARGIDAKRMTTTAYGEEKAPQGELSEEELQENRKTVNYLFFKL